MTSLNRRRLLKSVAAGATSALGASLFPDLAKAASAVDSAARIVKGGAPKRVIFFMQNQGFDPKTCIPSGMTGTGSLAKAKSRRIPSRMMEREKDSEQVCGRNGLYLRRTDCRFDD